MKTRTPFNSLLALAVIVLSGQFAKDLWAQNPNSAPASAEAAVPASANATRPVQLSPGVTEVLKLIATHASDDTITAFIRSSGRTYRLSASEILYLRQQGVSDSVLAAMLNQRENVAATAGQAAPQPGVTEVLRLIAARTSEDTIIAFIRSSGRTYDLSASEILYLRQHGVSEQVMAAMLNPQQNVTATAGQAAPAPTQFAPFYDAAAPVYFQPSPVFAYPAPTYGYYNSGPYPYGWAFPAFSFGFGYGSGYYGGYHGGGYYGGSYRGGGYYGGGYRGGGYYGGGYRGGGYYGGGYHGGGYQGGGGGHR